MPSSVAPIPKSLLRMAGKNQRNMEQKKRNKLTRNLREARRAAENKERVEKAYSKLQARLNALKRKSPKKTKSSNKFVKVTSNNLKGYTKKKSSKKTKGRSTTLNRMTKKVLKAFRK